LFCSLCPASTQSSSIVISHQSIKQNMHPICSTSNDKDRRQSISLMADGLSNTTNQSDGRR
jgi:hypothetical protein